MAILNHLLAGLLVVGMTSNHAPLLAITIFTYLVMIFAASYQGLPMVQVASEWIGSVETALVVSLIAHIAGAVALAPMGFYGVVYGLLVLGYMQIKLLLVAQPPP